MFASRGLTHSVAIGGTVLVLTLNLSLVLQTFGILFVAIYLLADTRKLKAAYLWMIPSAFSTF